MRIPESIIQAAEWGLGENFNHVILKCGQDKREEIGELFKVKLTAGKLINKIKNG